MTPIPRSGTPSNVDKQAADLFFELLNSSTKVHLNHLLVSGPGAYAAHKAMNEFYDEVKSLADGLIEGYQGATERLLTFPTSSAFPLMNTGKDCLNYIRGLYVRINQLQAVIPYSEINNTLDEVKSLINSTKYKLIFLS